MVDNLGLWFFYCYIQFYLVDGMFVFLNEFFFRLFFVLEGFLKCGNFENNGNYSNVYNVVF